MHLERAVRRLGFTERRRSALLPGMISPKDRLASPQSRRDARGVHVQWPNLDLRPARILRDWVTRRRSFADHAGRRETGASP